MRRFFPFLGRACRRYWESRWIWWENHWGFWILGRKPEEISNQLSREFKPRLLYQEIQVLFKIGTKYSKFRFTEISNFIILCPCCVEDLLLLVGTIGLQKSDFGLHH